MTPINVYIGYDNEEPIAWHVAAHSLFRKSTVPVSITPLDRDTLRDVYWRPRGERDSTDFSNSRWIVPALQGYQGWALFVDSDVLFLNNIANLWALRDDRYAVMVVKHRYTPKTDTKFLGREQQRYDRKNWSSVMLFNCERCRMLTPHIVNTMSPALWFHHFDWVPDDEIGELPSAWNHLVGEYPPADDVSLAHLTLGGPWHGITSDYAESWWMEYHQCLQGDNPVDYRRFRSEERQAWRDVWRGHP